MTVRSASYSLVIVALAFVSMGGDCTLGSGDTQPHPPARACVVATPVMDGTMLTAQDTSKGSDTLVAACQPLAVGPVLYYKATIPAGETLTAKTTGPSALRILSGCGATTCLASDADKGSGAGVTVAYMNATFSPPLDVILALGSSNAAAPGSYGLTVSIK
jgi:hypothetical protein